MDNLVQECRHSCSINLFGFDHILAPTPSDHREFAFLPNHPNPTSLEEEGYVYDAVLKYISQVLMDDEDLENRPSVLQDSLALQEAEKSLYDLLGEKYPPSPDHSPPLICENVESPDDDFTSSWSSRVSHDSSASVNKIIDFNPIGDQNKFGYSLVQSSHVDHNFDVVDGTVDSLVDSFQVLDPSIESQAISWFRGGEGEVTQILSNEDCENYDLARKERTQKVLGEAEKNWRENSPHRSRGKKSHYREDGDDLEAGRSNKQLASYDEDSDEQSVMYDNVLLGPAFNPHLLMGSSACLLDEGPESGVGRKLQKNRQSKGSSGGKTRRKKQGTRREVVDLMTLLTQCAQAMASSDSRTANELLKQIRQHSSPRGDGTERLAHYIANALEMRLAGTVRALDTSVLIQRLSAADTIKAYMSFLTACPFQKMSHFFANKLIWKLSEKATRLHIIDFGITHGFQWPSLIQHLSLRPGGPPRVRITGIDFPQTGFRPAQRVEETGRRLKYYCERFNVPFEYNSVAKQWDTIRLEDLEIQRDEVLVVNCLYWLRCVPDETIENSPRDAVLNLIKSANPDLFIHGIVNGTYNAPFFVTRFREVLFQAYSMFDMYDAILPRDDLGRMVYEREVLGGGTMTVIACEGTERIIRPETYKQWQIRNTKAGLRQLPLDREIMEDVRSKVKLGYHKDFVLDEDGNWMLQGWKGRISSAISSWKPAQEKKI